MLGLLAADLEVAELGVGQQHAVVDHRRADAGAERQQHDDAGVVAARAELLLGQSGGVGVVEHGHLLAVELPCRRTRWR